MGTRRARTRRKTQTPAPVKDTLTGKQRAFVEHYIACRMNATEAARLAGYQGCDNTLRSIASENLTKPNIKAAISERFESVAMTADEVLLRLADQARVDPGDFMDIESDGTYRLNLDKAKRAGKLPLIKKLTATQYGPGLELHDSHAALVDIGKHLKLFGDRVEVSGPGGGPMQSEVVVRIDGLSEDTRTRRAQIAERIARIEGTADTTMPGQP